MPHPFRLLKASVVLGKLRGAGLAFSNFIAREEPEARAGRGSSRAIPLPRGWPAGPGPRKGPLGRAPGPPPAHREHTHTHSRGRINTARTARTPRRSRPSGPEGPRFPSRQRVTAAPTGRAQHRRVRSSRAQARGGDPARPRADGRCGPDGPGGARTGGSARPQLSTQRSRRLSCRLSLRRRCSRPRSRRSSSSRALRRNRVKSGRASAPPRSRPSGSPRAALPAPSAPRPHSHPLLLVQVSDQLVALVHQRHQLLQQELLPVLLRGRFQPVWGQRRLRVRGLQPPPRPGPQSLRPNTHLQWPAWPVAPGSAARTSALSPALRCWGVGCQVRERGRGGSAQGSDHSTPRAPAHLTASSHRGLD